MRFRVYYYTVHVEYNRFNHFYPPFLKLPKGISVLMSSSIVMHAGIIISGQMRLPGIIVTRAPSFTFAKSVPPPTLQFLPMIESPTYARCDTKELSITMLFFTSTAWPILQFFRM